MDSNIETFGAWQGCARLDARSGAIALLPVSVGVDTTGASFAAFAVATTDAATTDAAVTGLGQPQAMRTHKSYTRPGSPPRGRHR